MEITLLLQTLLVGSFLVVSVAFAIKLIIEAYLYYVEVTTGIKIVQEELQQQQEDMDEQ